MVLKIELLGWPAAQQEAQRIRFTVFVEEQRVPADLEMDENDAASLHALAYADGQAIGTGRLLPDGHIGRMAVLKQWRGQGAGRAMLQRLIDANFLTRPHMPCDDLGLDDTLAEVRQLE